MVMDASTLKSVSDKKQIEQYDVAECSLQTAKKIAFDLSSEIRSTGRFVIVDEFDIAACGVVLEAF